MRLLEFSHEGVAGAAKGVLDNLGWRIVTNIGFALAAAFAVRSPTIPALWLAALLVVTTLDGFMARRYLATTAGEKQDRARLAFLMTSLGSVIIYLAIVPVIIWYGGGPARMMSVLLAASSLVAMMIYLYTAPGFMIISVTPTVLLLLTVPFLPSPQIEPAWLPAAISMGISMLTFLVYLGRAAIRTDEMFRRLVAATRTAEARRAEAEAGSLAKTKFLAQVTHEMRTPLNAVIGYAEILREDLESGRGIHPDDADRIAVAGWRLVEVVDHAIEASNIDTGKMRFDADVVEAVLSRERALT